MITKFISLATAIVTLDVYLQSRLSSSDPLFFFTSNNLVVNYLILFLSALMIAISFKRRFGSWLSYYTCSILAVLFCSLGLAGAVISDVNIWLSNILLPLDYLFILETGIVMGLSALTLPHPVRSYNYQFPRLQFLLNKLRFAFPVPKIPHSPQPAQPRRTRLA